MTDLDILEKLRKIFGGQIYTTKKRKEHWKDCWVWKLGTSDKAVECMRLILPFMGERRTERITELISRYDECQRVKDEYESKKQKMVKEYFAGGISMRALGKKYNVSRTTVLNEVNKTHGGVV